MEIKPIKEEKAIVYPNKSNIAKGTISLMSTMNVIDTKKIIFKEEYLIPEAVAVVSTVPPIINYIGITCFGLILLNILSILMIIKNTFNKKKYVKANDESKIEKYKNKLRKNYRFFWISLAILWILSYAIETENELIILISKLLVQILPVIILIRLAYLTTNIIECIVNNKKSNSKKSNIKYVLSLIGLIVLMRSYYI